MPSTSAIRVRTPYDRAGTSRGGPPCGGLVVLLRTSFIFVTILVEEQSVNGYCYAVTGDRTAPDGDVPVAGSAFLLTQIGTHAAEEFAARVAGLDLTPPQAG